jgi:hypothetical protein
MENLNRGMRPSGGPGGRSGSLETIPRGLVRCKAQEGLEGNGAARSEPESTGRDVRSDGIRAQKVAKCWSWLHPKRYYDKTNEGSKPKPYSLELLSFYRDEAKQRGYMKPITHNDL